MDPLAFRAKNLIADPGSRRLAIVNALQTIAKWTPKVAASNLSEATVVRGRGIAVAGLGDLSPSTKSGYGGAVADIEVNKKTGKILVKHIYAALDVGLAVNPALVENQMSGSLIQTTSRMLHEAIAFNTSRVTSLD